MKRKGFTLIELLAVIVILAVIMVIAVPQILKVIDKAETKSAENSIKLLKSAIKTQTASAMITNKNFEKEDNGCYIFDFDNKNNNYNNLDLKNKEQFSGSISYCGNSFDDNSIVFNGIQSEKKSECTGKCSDEDNDMKISFGDMMTFNDEIFYVVNNNGDNLDLLPKYNIDPTSKRQSSDAGTITFSSERYWASELSSETDDYVYSEESNLYPIIEEYITHLKNDVGIESASGRLLTNKEIRSKLTVVSKLSNYSGDYYSPEWLVSEDHPFWLGNANDTFNGNGIWFISKNSNGNASFYSLQCGTTGIIGVRPVVNISIDELN